MSGSDDPYVSFGRCYFDNSGDEAPDRFIPCGNVNFGNVTCCQSQDMCLSSNACYNPQYGMTYIAGCTDESYEDDSCPSKGNYVGDAWVGVTYCNGTSNEWVGCEDNRSPSTVTTTNPCWCPETSRTVAFSDASVLANVVGLPSSTGESLDWQGGFLPSTESVSVSATATDGGSSGSPAFTSAETTTQSTEINGTPTTTTIISTTTSSADNTGGSSSGGLNTGAKVGIGVGVGAVAAGVVALLIWLSVRSRKKRHNMHTTPKETAASPQQDSAFISTHVAQKGRYYGNNESTPLAFGHKSELDAVDTTATTPVTPSPRTDRFNRPLSEVQGSPAQGSDGRPLRDGGWEMPGQMGPIYEKPT